MLCARIALPAAVCGALEALVETLSTSAAFTNRTVRVGRGSVISVSGRVSVVHVSLIWIRRLAGISSHVRGI